jgi:hypothetical protein
LVGRKNLPANGRKLPPERFGHAENVSRFSDRQLARTLQSWRRQIGKVVAMNINSAVRSYFPPGGSHGVSAFSSAGAGDTMTSSLDARANAASGVTTYDFSQMSRSQMQGVAQSLYKSGQIDLTQLGMPATGRPNRKGRTERGVRSVHCGRTGRYRQSAGKLPGSLAGRDRGDREPRRGDGSQVRLQRLEAYPGNSTRQPGLCLGS